MKTSRIITGLALILVGLSTGCNTTRFLLNPAALPSPDDVRQGTLAVKFTDRRPDKTRVGYLKRVFSRTTLVLSNDLETALGGIFKETLEQAGYTVAPTATPTLEGEIREFWAHGNGFTQGASEKIRLILRGKGDEVLWQRTVNGEDGGMDAFSSSPRKSMDVALTRLLAAAMNEFTSETFYQSVKKGAAEDREEKSK